jgi:hypothetical protein
MKINPLHHPGCYKLAMIKAISVCLGGGNGSAERLLPQAALGAERP